MTDRLGLKFGTIKVVNVTSEAANAALQAVIPTLSCGSVMQQDRSPEHKEALCKLIDAVFASGGEVWSDWSGETFPTANAAKDYVRNYGVRHD